MSISRRKFIKIGSVSAAFIVGNSLGLGNAAFGQTRQNPFVRQLPAEVYNDILMSYHAENFRNLIGSNFSLFAEGFVETAVLVKVEEKTPNRKSKNKNQIVSTEDFTLSFRVSTPSAKQATYTVINSDLGQFDLLLVPAKNAKGENLLNAVINRL